LGEEQYRLEIGEDWAAASERWAAGGCVYSTSFALMDADDDAVLQRALRQLQALGAKPAAAIFARNLRKCSPLHVPRGHRATTRPNPASLTPRELQVLTLLAGGLRNSEIAARLFCRRRPSTTTSPRSFASSASGTERNALIEPRCIPRLRPLEELPAWLEQGASRAARERPPWEAKAPFGELAAAGFAKLVISGTHPVFEAVCDTLVGPDQSGAGDRPRPPVHDSRRPRGLQLTRARVPQPS
jgi:hypothetical protein